MQHLEQNKMLKSFVQNLTNIVNNDKIDSKKIELIKEQIKFLSLGLKGLEK